MDYKELYEKLLVENKELKIQINKEKFSKLPHKDDYEDDPSELEEALVNVMMSGDLSEEELKEAFKRLTESMDWGHITKTLWNLPKGTLWKIKDNILYFNSHLLYPPGPQWLSVRNLYDDLGINDIGEYINCFNKK